MRTERIAPVGYINLKKKHALISIYNPPTINAGTESVQVILSIKGARKLYTELETFLINHNLEENKGEER